MSQTVGDADGAGGHSSVAPPQYAPAPLQPGAAPRQEITEAVFRSQADRLNADGVILARLNFHAPELLQLPGSASLLSGLRATVVEASCEPSPAWAEGALLLVPATQEQIGEAGIKLKKHRILMHSEDRPLVERVLKASHAAGGLSCGQSDTLKESIEK